MPILIGDFIQMYYVDEMPLDEMSHRLSCSTENIRRFRNSCGLPDRRRKWSDSDEEELDGKISHVCNGADFEGDMRSLAFSMRHKTSTVRFHSGERWLMRFAPNAVDRKIGSSKTVKIPEIRFKRTGQDVPIPAFATSGSAGIDLSSMNDHCLKAGEVHTFWTGLCIEIPNGYVGLVCSRSGLAAKHGLIVLNSPGIIDSDYRGNDDVVGVILYNTGAVHEEYKVSRGDRIAQLVIVPFARFEMREVDDMDAASRGGIGSTGR